MPPRAEKGSTGGSPLRFSRRRGIGYDRPDLQLPKAAFQSFPVTASANMCLSDAKAVKNLGAIAAKIVTSLLAPSVDITEKMSIKSDFPLLMPPMLVLQGS